MIKVLELFGGIGACSKALSNLGIDYKIVDYVEIDKYAVKSFNAIHNTSFEPQDITTYNKDIDVDLIMHGSPCQDFSLSGKQAGGDKDSGTRSSLMYETLRIVKELHPKVVIWENVKNVLSKKHIHNFNRYESTMRYYGYVNYYKVLNSKDYGIPQNRERIFVVSIRSDLISYKCHQFNYKFPEAVELKLKLKDFLDNTVEDKYYLSEKMIKYISATGSGTTNYISDILPDNYNLSIKIKNATKLGYLEAYAGDGVDISSRMKYHRGTVQKDSIQTLDCTGGEGHGVVTNDLRIRKLTPRECWRLMGFSDDDFDKASKVNSDTQLYKQAGNSIVVPVLEAILKELFKVVNV